ncbi:hypothetical protein PPERSA_08603 [Pseudocohnilembus persalinus]|uniref:Uncharacterized protein n=1 Tax=Pseudocohnilembus persalinus TaxID=266149 RepID=A0A0V0R1K1_PSEPJ|nr:hypothetical protein PPERSA_08603 [Pseudocohnilembus persalinus]|eukprot:KRX08404.1 hypothetical protein PPERSA_08603 [Pseudocohnilembus persalinus]
MQKVPQFQSPLKAEFMEFSAQSRTDNNNLCPTRTSTPNRSFMLSSRKYSVGGQQQEKYLEDTPPKKVLNSKIEQLFEEYKENMKKFSDKREKFRKRNQSVDLRPKSENENVQFHFDCKYCFQNKQNSILNQIQIQNQEKEQNQKNQLKKIEIKDELLRIANKINTERAQKNKELREKYRNQNVNFVEIRGKSLDVVCSSKSTYEIIQPSYTKKTTIQEIPNQYFQQNFNQNQNQHQVYTKDQNSSQKFRKNSIQIPQNIVYISPFNTNVSNLNHRTASIRKNYHQNIGNNNQNNTNKVFESDKNQNLIQFNNQFVIRNQKQGQQNQFQEQVNAFNPNLQQKITPFNISKRYLFQ